MVGFIGANYFCWDEPNTEKAFRCRCISAYHNFDRFILLNNLLTMKRLTQEDIVQVLTTKRKALKLSQKDVAHFLGSTNQSIMNYEKGHSDIPLKKFVKWCELLNLNFYLD